MRTATVCDLRYDFPKTDAWLAGGEEIVITRHSKAIAGIRSAALLESTAETPLPDFEARRKKTWGDRFFTQQEVDELRAFETGEP